METKVIPSIALAGAAAISEGRQGRISTLDQLSTSILHDLRNPLASICGCSEMLLDLDLTPEQVKRLSRNIH